MAAAVAAVTAAIQQRMRFRGGVFKTLGIRPTAKQYRLADDTVGGAHILITGRSLSAPFTAAAAAAVPVVSGRIARHGGGHRK